MKVWVLGVAMGTTGLASGCGGGSAEPTERLWVSEIPTDPKVPMAAFLTMRAEQDRYLGAFFQGSLLRGGHDVFQWEDAGKHRARVRFLQDDREAELRLESCTPSFGFDYCLVVRGDRAIAGRYQSRKRWVVRRPGRTRSAAASAVVPVMLELAEDDAELAAAFDAAATVAEGPRG